jgi:N-carbamoyl-L-amino-acid hydrolase
MSGAKAVREDRLWQRHADMAKLGGTPKGGVNRQALSPEDAAARNLLASWAKARGFSLFTDAIGNLFVRREGSDPQALPVMSGSHMDSQPTGGRFDGMYGVLAAFEALEALEDAGLQTKRPLIAVAWTNEEGSRFAPAMMASAAYVGDFTADDILSRKDAEGITVAQALDSIGYRGASPVGTQKFTSFVELHIEQGPLLEAENKTIGVVDSGQGVLWYDGKITGFESHAGSTPMPLRRDALATLSEPSARP